MTPWKLFLIIWVFRRTVTVKGDRDFSEIMQIVTSGVHIDVALTLSRRPSLFAPPNSCGTRVVFVHADAQSLCAAGACSLSEQYHWARLRSSPQRGLNLGRGYDRHPSVDKPLGAVTTVTPVWTEPLGAVITVTPVWMNL